MVRLTKTELVKRRLNKRIRGGIYFDNVKSGALGEPVKETDVIVTSEAWEGSEGYSKVWNKIDELRNKIRRNAANLPADYYTLVDLMRIDITRRRVEEQDYTDVITTEVVNPAFSRSVRLDEFLPYAGVFEKIDGAGETVPLIQAKTGVTGSVDIDLYGLGFTRTLEDELYNLTIYDLEKVNAAVARAHTARRNQQTIGTIVGATYDASQQVSADTTGSTPDEKLYNTLSNAIDTLQGLKDPMSGQLITVNQATLLVNPVDARRCQRVIAGNVALKQVGTIFSPLSEITEMIEYAGDTIYVGAKKYTFNGVPSGKAYLFVPGTAYVLTKRALTQEVGRGDVLQLAREARAWYFAQGEYFTDFLGSSAPGTTLDAGYGWIVEITLP